MNSKTRLVHLLRQSLVTAGVSLSMAEHSMVLGFTAILLPQLRQDPSMKTNIYIESWIASINALSFFPGVMMCPFIMRRYGRRKANLVSAVFMIIGWTCISLASDVNVILISKILQGAAVGLSSMSATILIGEYTSPKYRGSFLSIMMFSILLGSLMVHMIGSFLVWNRTALFCLAVAILDATIVSLSPETPVFLAKHGRYDECRKVFRWLHGPDEEDELNAMIKAAVSKKAKSDANNENGNEKNKGLLYVIDYFKRSDFYKPLILMLHLDVIELWCGYTTIETYAIDILHKILGHDINVSKNVIVLDTLKILSSVCAIHIHTKLKRCAALKLFVGMNILTYASIAGYSYLREEHIFENIVVGSTLTYLFVFSFCAGTMPLMCTISSEIFPLEYKEISTMITTLFASLNITLKMQTFPYLVNVIGIHGAFSIYALILTYALIVASIMLPETKDKTLQNIEEEYWTKPYEMTVVSQNDELTPMQVTELSQAPA
ncbi:facilitated trehalose transporter Tret1-like [Galleria mellonella]|uniref:Facilitated trehalose transporter Tret1-like n=1 Tax=Galleria mellonella TaxID=7137 RepID=A0ABM3MP02_GALME|nr:facilitated trehalose transporter Tret1-like [Galleria mellonella]